MVTVRVTETYDLKTQVGKLGIIGIHTPRTSLLAKVWGNAIKSHAKIRLSACSVTMACASVLPADPLQVGVESGKIAPEDMFNPILYTACSNEGYDNIVNRIMSASDLLTGGSVNYETSEASTVPASVYYGLLAEGRFKKAMPQTGFSMRGLRPFVHSLVATYGNAISDDSTYGEVGMGSTSKLFTTPGAQGQPVSSSSRIMRGKTYVMPAIPTVAIYGTSTQPAGTQYDASFPKTMVACIITPPAVLNEFYFRLKVTWYIDLIGLRSDIQCTPTITSTSTLGLNTYYKGWTEPSSKLDSETEMVDTKDASITPIMQGYQ